MCFLQGSPSQALSIQAAQGIIGEVPTPAGASNSGSLGSVFLVQGAPSLCSPRLGSVFLVCRAPQGPYLFSPRLGSIFLVAGHPWAPPIFVLPSWAPFLSLQGPPFLFFSQPQEWHPSPVPS